MPPLNLDPFKPDPGDDIDATQVAGGFSAVEAWSTAIDPSSLGAAGALVGQALIWNGTAWAPASTGPSGPTIYRIPQVTIVNSAALTPLINALAIPGGTFGTNKRLHVVLEGDHLNNTGAGQSLQITVSLGGVLIFDHTTATGNAAAQRTMFWVRFDLYADGDTGHVAISDGEFKYPAGATASGTGWRDLNDGGIKFGAAAVAVDTTVNQPLTVNAKLQSANPLLDLHMRHGTVEVV